VWVVFIEVFCDVFVGDDLFWWDVVDDVEYLGGEFW